MITGTNTSMKVFVYIVRSSSQQINAQLSSVPYSHLPGCLSSAMQQTTVRTDKKNPWTRWQPLCICHSFECNGTANPTGKKNPDPNPGSDWRVLVCIYVLSIFLLTISDLEIITIGSPHRVGLMSACIKTHSDWWLDMFCRSHVPLLPCPDMQCDRVIRGVWYKNRVCSVSLSPQISLCIFVTAIHSYTE